MSWVLFDGILVIGGAGNDVSLLYGYIFWFLPKFKKVQVCKELLLELVSQNPDDIMDCEIFRSD